MRFYYQSPLPQHRGAPTSHGLGHPSPTEYKPPRQSQQQSSLMAWNDGHSFYELNAALQSGPTRSNNPFYMVTPLSRNVAQTVSGRSNLDHGDDLPNNAQAGQWRPPLARHAIHYTHTFQQERSTPWSGAHTVERNSQRGVSSTAHGSTMDESANHPDTSTTISIASPPPPTRVVYIPKSNHALPSLPGPIQPWYPPVATLPTLPNAAPPPHHEPWPRWNPYPMAVTPMPPHFVPFNQHGTQHSTSNAICTDVTASTDLVYDVSNVDVLCGRGAPSLYHVGNQQFRRLVEAYQSQYMAARRLDKPDIAMRIVQVIRSRGGRFLKRTKVLSDMGTSGHFGWYVLATDNAP
jgi:hypothetical protein